MKILVCITHVPDTTAPIAFTADGKHLEKQSVSFIVGPYDDYALARAVELKASSDAEVVVLHVGQAEAEASLRKALAVGADRAIRIDTEAVDAHFVAFQIANVLKKEPFDLVMMGKESIDFNGGVVHAMVGALLDLPVISPVMGLDLKEQRAYVRREIEGGTEDLEADLPLILGCQEPIAEWKIPNMRGIMTARAKPLEVLPAAEVEARTETLAFDLPKARTTVKLFPNDGSKSW